MKRLTLALFALGLVVAAVTCLVAAATTTTVERTPALAKRTAVVFDTSPPFGLMAQFIPDKSVVIHPAVESQPERGVTEGPGTGLGTTPPTPPAARGGSNGRVSADSAAARARDQRRRCRRRADDAGLACRD